MFEINTLLIHKIDLFHFNMEEIILLTHTENWHSKFLKIDLNYFLAKQMWHKEKVWNRATISSIDVSIQKNYI